MTTTANNPPRKKIVVVTGKRAARENIIGWLFVLPAVAIILIFGLFPIGYSTYMSLFSWRVAKGPFIGLGNYQKLIGDWLGLAVFIVGLVMLFGAYLIWENATKEVNQKKKNLKYASALVLIAGGALFSVGWNLMYKLGDKDFLNSLIVTFFYAVFSVPLQLLLGMILAFLLFQNIRGKDAFRIIYFLPYVTPVVTTAVVFRTIFNMRESSLANIFLSWFGAGPWKWLFEPKSVLEVMFGIKTVGMSTGPSLALISIIIFGVWTFVGYNVVIFLAGLGGISKELYEAAEIDGASKWDLFKRITMPLLSPVTFYLLLYSFIGTFKAFNHIYVMSTPNAQKTVVTTAVNVFNTFYVQNNFGYSASQAILLFLIILGLTVAQNKIFGEKVFYG